MDNKFFDVDEADDSYFVKRAEEVQQITDSVANNGDAGLPASVCSLFDSLPDLSPHIHRAWLVKLAGNLRLADGNDIGSMYNILQSGGTLTYAQGARYIVYYVGLTNHRFEGGLALFSRLAKLPRHQSNHCKSNHKLNTP